MGSSQPRPASFGADGQDLFVLDSNFDAEGRANIAALDDGPADPDIAGEVGGFEGIVEVWLHGLPTRG